MKLEVNESRAREIDLTADTSVFIVENSVLEMLLFDRSLVGVPFRNLCHEATRLFIRHIKDELKSLDLAELLILSKGLVYQLADAYAAETNDNLPVNVIATTRMHVEGDSVKIDVPYSRFDAGGTALLIGDTVASGATVIAALEEYTSQQELSSVYLMSYAGSAVGAKRIAGYCSKHNIHLRILLGLAAFGLGVNGFDLSFLDPDTITNPIYVDRARSLYDGKRLSAVGWDFGTQLIAPRKYRELSWVESLVTGVPAKVFGEVMPIDAPNHLWRERGAFDALASTIWPDAIED